MVAKVITFANVKGGSGKSTLCINMAAILIRAGYSVALVDADQQKCSQDWIIETKDELLSKVKIIDQAEDGIRGPEMSRGLGDVYKRQSRSRLNKRL